MDVHLESLDYGFVRLEEHKIIPTSMKNKKTSGAKENHNGSGSSRPNAHRRASSNESGSDASSINISLASALLPPNTGPPGTVPVTNGGNANNSNKNLSHVPCKFYRQGNCQAGSSCPFSHNLDGTLAADKLPCKYFQKGNCKFGLKCALAHYLPDGTKVNQKGLLGAGYGYRRSSNHSNVAQPLSTDSHDTLDVAPLKSSTPVSKFLNIGNSGSVGSGNSFGSLSQIGLNGTQSMNTGGAQALYSFQNGLQLGSHNGQNGMQGPSTQNLGLPNGYGLSHSSSLNNISHSSLTNQNSLGAAPTSQALWSHSYDRSGRRFVQSSPNHFSTTSPQNQFMLQHYLSPSQEMYGTRNSFSRGSGLFAQYSPPNYDFNSSAIVDDEDSLEDSGDVFEEDYVPASLSDLILTPQELVRRDLRSQSGTLLVRPNLGNILLSAGSLSSSVESQSTTQGADDTTSTSPHHVHNFQNDAFKKKPVSTLGGPINGDDVFLME